jgi:hypothetical protein
VRFSVMSYYELTWMIPLPSPKRSVPRSCSTKRPRAPGSSSYTYVNRVSCNLPPVVLG